MTYASSGTAGALGWESRHRVRWPMVAGQCTASRVSPAASTWWHPAGDQPTLVHRPPVHPACCERRNAVVIMSCKRSLTTAVIWSIVGGNYASNHQPFGIRTIRSPVPCFCASSCRHWGSNQRWPFCTSTDRDALTRLIGLVGFDALMRSAVKLDGGRRPVWHSVFAILVQVAVRIRQANAVAAYKHSAKIDSMPRTAMTTSSSRFTRGAR
jgi:hypothetical protein